MCARSTPLFPDNCRQFCEGAEVALILSLAEFTQSCICQTGTQIIVGEDPVARRLQTLRQPTQECHKFVKADNFVGSPPVCLPDCDGSTGFDCHVVRQDRPVERLASSRLQGTFDKHGRYTVRMAIRERRHPSGSLLPEGCQKQSCTPPSFRKRSCTPCRRPGRLLSPTRNLLVLAPRHASKAPARLAAAVTFCCISRQRIETGLQRDSNLIACLSQNTRRRPVASCRAPVRDR